MSVKFYNSPDGNYVNVPVTVITNITTAPGEHWAIIRSDKPLWRYSHTLVPHGELTNEPAFVTHTEGENDGTAKASE